MDQFQTGNEFMTDEYLENNFQQHQDSQIVQQSYQQQPLQIEASQQVATNITPKKGRFGRPIVQQQQPQIQQQQQIAAANTTPTKTPLFQSKQQQPVQTFQVQGQIGGGQASKIQNPFQSSISNGSKSLFQDLSQTTATSSQPQQQPQIQKKSQPVSAFQQQQVQQQQATTQQQQQQSAIQQKLKKIKKTWPEGSRLHKMMGLNQLVHSKYNKKRYAVSFQYVDGADGKIKQKTVRFGKFNQKYLTDGIQPIDNQILVARMKKFQSPFDSNFWCITLLSKVPNLEQAYKDFVFFNDLL